VDTVREVGDQILEISGDAADGRVARRQLFAEMVEAIAETGPPG
jgi:hypothetical protein